jgi:hypothetical protein
MTGARVGSGDWQVGVARQVAPGVTALGPVSDMQHPNAIAPQGCALHWRHGIIVLRAQGGLADTDRVIAFSACPPTDTPTFAFAGSTNATAISNHESSAVPCISEA